MHERHEELLAAMRQEQSQQASAREAVRLEEAMMYALEHGVNLVTIDEAGVATLTEKVYWYPDASEG